MGLNEKPASSTVFSVPIRMGSLAVAIGLNSSDGTGVSVAVGASVAVLVGVLVG